MIIRSTEPDISYSSFNGKTTSSAVLLRANHETNNIISTISSKKKNENRDLIISFFYTPKCLPKYHQNGFLDWEQAAGQYISRDGDVLQDD